MPFSSSRATSQCSAHAKHALYSCGTATTRQQQGNNRTHRHRDVQQVRTSQNRRRDGGMHAAAGDASVCCSKDCSAARQFFVLTAQRVRPSTQHGRGSPHRAAHALRLEGVLECQHHAAEQRIAPQTHQRDEQVRRVHVNSRGPVPLATSDLRAGRDTGASGRWFWRVL